MDDVRVVVLVEGISDQAALEALARRRGRDLAAEGIRIVSMGGATNVRTFLEHYGPHGQDVRLAGLCDAGEADLVRRRLADAGLDAAPGPDGMEALGFHVCVADLEDELIRAVGTQRVERVVEAAGELASFRIFQNQPAQRKRRPEAQLRRFMGTRKGRKARYARLLVDALDLTRVPRPLDRVLDVRG